MKAVLYDAPRSFSVTDVPKPDPAPDEVLVKVLQSGICGTDLHIHEGHFYAEFPLVPGHEVVGTVEAMGPDVVGFEVGEAVSVNPNINCGNCQYCRSGQTLLCRDLKGIGTNWPGSFAEYMSVPQQFVYSVEGIDPDVAVFTEPAACAMHGLESLELRPGATALIFGAGPTGLLFAQLLVHGGAAHVTVAASSQFKLDRAQALGIDQTLLVDRANLEATAARLKTMSDGGFDVVVEATGSAKVGELCVPLTRSGGTVLVYGVTEPTDRISFSPFDVFRREITIRGSFAEINSFASAIRALRSGRARTTGLITHRFSLDNYGDALNALRTDRSVHKIVVTV
jgi:D-arabinitol dehydrogenase (NADP+)